MCPGYTHHLRRRRDQSESRLLLHLEQGPALQDLPEPGQCERSYWPGYEPHSERSGFENDLKRQNDWLITNA